MVKKTSKNKPSKDKKSNSKNKNPSKKPQSIKSTKIQATKQKNKLKKDSPSSLSQYDQLYASQKFSDALEGYEKLLKSSPDDSDLLYKKGLCLYYLTKYDEALAVFRKVTESKPTDPEAYCDIALILEIQKGDSVGAIENYNKAVSLDTNFERGYYNKGYYHYSKKEDALAAECFGKAIECPAKKYSISPILPPSKVDEYYTRGQCYYYMGNYDKAEADYKKAIELNATHAKSFLGLGLVYYQRYEYAKSLEAYNKTIELNPSSAIAFFDRALVYWYGYKNSEKAIADIDSCLKLNPKDDRAYEEKGKILANLGQAEPAKEALKAALKINPQLKDASSKLAELEAGKLISGESENAAEYLVQENIVRESTSALNKNANNVKALFDRAKAQYSLKRYGDAIADFNKILGIEPNNVKALYWKGVSQYFIKYYDDAFSTFMKVLEKEPNNAEAHCDLALIYEIIKKDLQNALSYYNKAISLDENFERGYFNLGLYYNDRKDYLTVIEKMTKAINCTEKKYEMTPIYPPSKGDEFYRRGLANYYLKEYEKARADYEKVISVNPKDHRPYIDIGLIYYNKYEYDQSIKYYTKAIEVNPKSHIAYYDRALSYRYGFSDNEKALADLNKCLELDKGYANAYEEKGKILQEQGKNNEAKEEFRKALNINPTLPDSLAKIAEIEKNPNSTIEPSSGVMEPQKSDIKFKDIAGMEALKDALRFAVIEPLKNPELAKKFNKKIGGGIVMYGPPGCGKTFISRALAGEAGLKILVVKISDVLDKWIGNSEKKIHSVFEAARKNAPTVLFLDEIDGLGWKRTEMEHGWERSFVAQLLVELDNGDHKNDNIVVLASTNAPWYLDEALKRSGRFGTLIYVGPPDDKTRFDLFKYYLKDLPIEKKIDYNQLVKVTDHFSCADIQSVCERAANFAYKRSIMDGKGKEHAITMKDIQEAITKERSDLTEWYSSVKNMLGKDEMQELYPDLYDDLNRLISVFERKQKDKRIGGSDYQ